MQSETEAADASNENLNEAASAQLKQLEDLQAQLKDKDAKHLYLYAEFENYKKRATRENLDARKFGWENIARDLLQVLDNLERALAHTPAETDANLVTGLKMVLSQFKSTIQKQGVEEVAALGKAFDPNLQEAVGQEPSDKPAGVVTQEHVKGYTLNGRLLRPARVILSSGPQA
jgi:molecular chaperone GrpE